MDTITTTTPRRPLWRSLLRGFCRRCPHCGAGALFKGYLSLIPTCPRCGEPLGHIRADDGPAYFTVLLAGHLVVPSSLWVEQTWHPPLLPHMAAAIVLAVLLILLLLPVIKGGMVGVMWALGLKGDEMHAG